MRVPDVHVRPYVLDSYLSSGLAPPPPTHPAYPLPVRYPAAVPDGGAPPLPLPPTAVMVPPPPPPPPPPLLPQPPQPPQAPQAPQPPQPPQPPPQPPSAQADGPLLHWLNPWQERRRAHAALLAEDGASDGVPVFASALPPLPPPPPFPTAMPPTMPLPAGPGIDPSHAYHPLMAWGMGPTFGEVPCVRVHEVLEAAPPVPPSGAPAGASALPVAFAPVAEAVAAAADAYSAEAGASRPAAPSADAGASVPAAHPPPACATSTTAMGQETARHTGSAPSEPAQATAADTVRAERVAAHLSAAAGLTAAAEHTAGQVNAAAAAATAAAAEAANATAAAAAVERSSERLRLELDERSRDLRVLGRQIERQMQVPQIERCDAGRAQETARETAREDAREERRWAEAPRERSPEGGGETGGGRAAARLRSRAAHASVRAAAPTGCEPAAAARVAPYARLPEREATPDAMVVSGSDDGHCDSGGGGGSDGGGAHHTGAGMHERVCASPREWHSPSATSADQPHLHSPCASSHARHPPPREGRRTVVAAERGAARGEHQTAADAGGRRHATDGQTSGARASLSYEQAHRNARTGATDAATAPKPAAIATASTTYAAPPPLAAFPPPGEWRIQSTWAPLTPLGAYEGHDADGGACRKSPRRAPRYRRQPPPPPREAPRQRFLQQTQRLQRHERSSRQRFCSATVADDAQAQVVPPPAYDAARRGARQHAHLPETPSWPSPPLESGPVGAAALPPLYQSSAHASAAHAPFLSEWPDLSLGSSAESVDPARVANAAANAADRHPATHAGRERSDLGSPSSSAHAGLPTSGAAAAAAVVFDDADGWPNLATPPRDVPDAPHASELALQAARDRIQAATAQLAAGADVVAAADSIAAAHMPGGVAHVAGCGGVDAVMGGAAVSPSSAGHPSVPTASSRYGAADATDDQRQGSIAHGGATRETSLAPEPPQRYAIRIGRADAASTSTQPRTSRHPRSGRVPGVITYPPYAPMASAEAPSFESAGSVEGRPQARPSDAACLRVGDAELDLSAFDARSLRDSITGDLRASILRSRVHQTAGATNE